MAALPHAESWRLYSWWWDSHITTRSSKWLQDDLTGMDARVKLMIKLVEDDGDSFAMRAEMYYKRRPELMKLVEEFYRAYRSLAERYDNATRALHNRACPSHHPPSSSPRTDSECSTRRARIQSHGFSNADGASPGHFHAPRNEEFDPLTWRRGLKQVKEMLASSGGSESTVSPREKGQSRCQNLQEKSTKESEFELRDASEGAQREESKTHIGEPVKLQDREGLEEPEILVEDRSTRSMQDELDREGSPDRTREELEASPEKGRAHHREPEVESEDRVPEKCMLQLKGDKDNLHVMAEHMHKEVGELNVALQDEHPQALQAGAALESSKERHGGVQEELENASAGRRRCSQTARERENGNSTVRDMCRSYGEEEELLLRRLEDVEEPKTRLLVLLESDATLRERNSEKSATMRDKDAIQQDLGKLSERNLSPESSLGDADREMREMGGDLRRSEEMFWSLSQENFLLHNSQNALILQVEGFARNLEYLEEKYEELRDKHSLLVAEKDSALHQVSQLQSLLNIEKRERERAIRSSSNRIDALRDEAIHLGKEVQSKQAEIVNKEQELFGGALESFIFRRCLSDVKDKNLFLSKRQERLEQEFCDDWRRIRQLLENGSDDPKEKMSSAAGGVDEFDRMFVFKKIKELQDDYSLAREELEETVSWLTVNLDRRRKELLVVEERNEALEGELDKLKKENGQLRAKEEKLTSDLLNEVSCHEKETMALIEDGHLAAVGSMLYEEKVGEMMQMHQKLEMTDMAEITAVDAEMACVEKLRMECDNKEEEENRQLKADLDECRVLVSSLKESVSHLEDCIHLSRKHHLLHIHEIERDSDTRSEISHRRSPGPKMSTEVENLIVKLEEIQKYVTDSKGHGAAETFPSNTIVGASRHLQAPNLENQVHGTSKGIGGEKEICVVSAKDYKKRNDNNCENPDNGDEVILKYIQLDHSASIATHKGCTDLNESNIDSYYGQVWQTDERGQNSGIWKARVSAATDDDGKQQLISANKEGEMELVLHKAQASKKYAYLQHEWSNVVERVSLATTRLTTLQASVWELRRKLQTIGRSNQTSNLEFDATKGQLKRTQDSILKLVRTNEKLMKSARGLPSPSDGNNVEEARSQQQQALECERRESLKIGRLELEVQRAQCIVLELEEAVQRRRTRATRRVVLGDYLFGRADRRRSQQLCGCIETKDHCHVKRSKILRV